MKKILLIIFSITIIIEIVVLHQDNKNLIISNNTTLEELKQNNLIEDGKVSLDSVYKEEEEVREKVEELFSTTTFKVEDIEELITKEEDKSKELQDSISSLEEQIVGLEGNITTLEAEYNRLAKEYEEKNSAYITGVPTINQYPDYPTGCESVALTILLKYYGVSVTPNDIINKLEKGKTPYTKDDVTYGGNPEATGSSFDEILKIVKSGRPVLAWTSIGLSTPHISTSWIYEPTGETIYWKSGEHAVVIIGYTTDKIIISDPIGGKIKYQSLSLFRERYNYFGKKALYY